MSFKGRKNVYLCEKCGYPTVTIDRDEGTTPYMTRCRRPSGCDGTTVSQMYRVADWPLPPMFEWYKPDDGELRQKSAAVRQHVEMGGLLLRPIVEETAK